jgi:hypothetical protein
MADNSTKTGALLTWAGGIAATVIASVLIYYFTRPPAPIPTTQVGLDGFVADDVSQKPIANAMVTANLGSTVATQTTDSEGRYSFIMTTTAPTTGESINVDVLAGGYAHYTAAVPIASTGDTFAELPITSTAIAAPPPPLPGQPAAAAPTQPLRKPAPILRRPTNYNKRNDTAALKKK